MRRQRTRTQSGASGAALPGIADAPLSGTKVVEVGQLVAAPFCAMTLGTLGADVIKVEPARGDPARAFEPLAGEESAFYLSVNRSKRSFVVDMKHEQARDLMVKLIVDSDILVHNLRMGVAERLGIGYSELSKQKSSLIYCCISGFGAHAAEAERAGVDLIFQAESGIMSVTGEEGRPAVKIGTNAVDVHGGMTAAMCILAALRYRDLTGHGCRIDISLRDCAIALQATSTAIYFSTGKQPPRLGTASPFTAPTQAFETRDDVIVVAVVSDRHWQRFCDVMELGRAVLEDERFARNSGRVAHREDLISLLAPRFRTRLTEEWLQRFAEVGIPAGRILTYDEVFTKREAAGTSMLVLEHDRAGVIRVQGDGFSFQGPVLPDPHPPPVLDQHTNEILAELGFDEQEVQRLRTDRVVGLPDEDMADRGGYIP